jgi:Heavy-metal resistance
MIGFIVGTVCLIGLLKTLRRGYGGRCGGGYGYGGGCSRGGGWGGHGGGWGGHGRGHQGRGPWGEGGGDPSRWMLRGLFERLDTTPGQEKVILQAVETLREKGREGRDAVRGTGSDVAKAFRGERFDESAMADAFTRQDAALESAQKGLFEALAKVHEVLDERQRRELADMMERGLGMWSRWGAGPYRA